MAVNATVLVGILSRVGKNIRRGISFLIRYLGAAVYCLYVFSVGILFSQSRKTLNHLFRKLYNPLETIPEVDLSELTSWTLGPVPIELHYPFDLTGRSISFFELVAIAMLLRCYAPKRIFEIGTFNGRTTLNMAANSPADAIVYTLDLPPEFNGSTKLALTSVDKACIASRAGECVYQRFGYHHKIVQLYGDSALLDFAPFDAKIDMAFVDGSHSYENVLSDSLNMLQLLRDGKGILVWHDYTGSHPGVVKALNRLYSKHRSFARLRHVRGTTLVVLIVH